MGTSSSDSGPRPGIAPGARRAAGPMVAWLYGDLALHPWHAADSEHDAYQLFHQRSVAMGWLDDDAGGGLWGMNDAEWGRPLGSAGAGPIAWFQVESAPAGGERPLPVQAFLRCAEDVATRVGVLRADRWQVLVPVPGIDAASRPRYAAVPSMLSAQWFGPRNPCGRTPVTLGIDSGGDPAVVEAAPRLSALLRGLDQDVFRWSADGYTVASAPPPPTHDSLWAGPPRHGIAFEGESAEWSGDAAGWLAATVADAAARAEIRVPLLITLARTDSPR
ncbi:hypothetical protein [Yinghuangia soli]|uniref:Uncharacterized protein n=1 Tax=Yinghuangia soli TaxID=2908204 RepID=A0AA41U134_9ACTN|nr:hypothetical protein [Yinghuangia soli]MCF2529125.1 hypothetical protein [Yinghuangia soli]